MNKNGVITMKFNNNQKYENLVEELNETLYLIEQRKINNIDQTGSFPVIFKLGSSRSGSTLFTQWIASLGIFSYPSNFLSMFYKVPSIGARIYELMTNPNLTYNKEFDDIKRKIDFKSISGKTTGLKSPNEFWNFWLQYFKFPYVPVREDEFMKNANFEEFNKQLELIHKVFKKPFLIKAHNLNYYLRLFSKHINNAIYIHMYRDPIQVINSVIKARKTRWGDNNHWFGWKPKEYDIIKDMDIYYQVAGQVYFNEKAILNGKKYLGNRYLGFSYKDFCNTPHKIYNEIINLVNNYCNNKINNEYKGPEGFTISNNTKLTNNSKIKKAYQYFIDKYGNIRY